MLLRDINKDPDNGNATPTFPIMDMHLYAECSGVEGQVGHDSRCQLTTSHLSSILKHLTSWMCQHSSTQASHIETIPLYMTKCWLHFVNWTVVVFDHMYV